MYMIVLSIFLTLIILTVTPVDADVQVTWCGHACFMVTLSNKGKILLDPFDESLPYQLPSGQVDVVAASHRHSDHNNVDAVESSLVLVGGQNELEIQSDGSVKKLNLPAELTASIKGEGIPFKAILTYHDKQQGASRGLNTVFKFKADGLTFCHLGDLGQLLTDEQLEQIGEVDVLFVPVGGNYTIDASEATEVVKQIQPRIVFPMHYKTDVLAFPITGVDEFLEGKSRVENIDSHTVSLKAAEVKSLTGEPRIITLKYFDGSLALNPERMLSAMWCTLKIVY
jgi:L-ascorbate metabolism protein UlaG (beta-lactamase superfamily)